MQGNSINIGGNNGNFYFIEWQLATPQSIANNTSTINWQAYMHYNSADAQLDNGYATLGGAVRYSNGGRVYNFASNYTTRDMFITSGSFTVSHDGVGNYTLSVYGGITAYLNNRTEGSASWALPTIPRYASITGFTRTPITDVAFTVNVSVSDTCDLLETNLDGAGYVTSFSGDYTSKSVVIGGNLTSGITHTIQVRVRRKDSQLKTESSTVNVTTLSQNNFFGLL